jgi:23S rRNA (uracil1939-C5)-methyltransferase
VVFDLYSGTGTIALHVADDAATVIGVESVPSAVEDAHRNAEANGVTNCRFVLGDLKDRLLDRGTEAELAVRPDVILCDPPRAGMHPKVIESIRALHPGRIVYVSCNPATQARDCKMLCEDGMYALRESRPVDMFPHTTHVENVALLIARGGS